MSDLTKLTKIRADYVAVKKDFDDFVETLEKEIPDFLMWMWQDDDFEPLWNAERGELFHWYYFTKSNPGGDKTRIIKSIEVGNTH